LTETLCKTFENIPLTEYTSLSMLTSVTDISKAAQTMGAKGGRVAAAKMSPEERSAKMTKAVRARWAKRDAEKASQTATTGTPKSNPSRKQKSISRNSLGA
jgi:hypothetical protein